MPREYLAIEREQLRKGKSKKVAKRIAAATYNKRHPDNPVTKDYDKKHPVRRSSKKKKKKGKKTFQSQMNKSMKVLGY